VADTILRTFKAARLIDPAAQMMPAARGSGRYGKQRLVSKRLTEN
jgi:hypothetical protein